MFKKIVFLKKPKTILLKTPTGVISLLPENLKLELEHEQSILEVEKDCNSYTRLIIMPSICSHCMIFNSFTQFSLTF